MRLSRALHFIGMTLQFKPIYLGVWILVLAMCSGTGYADNIREWTIKAAYLFRLSLFVDWPEDKLTSSGTENVRFCITGEKQNVDTIESVLSNKSINQHDIEIINVTLQSELQSCHLLYISRDTQDKRLFLEAVANDSVLTMGDTDEFYRHGGMVLLFEKENRIHFAINIGQLDLSRIKVRAQLLNLAEQYP